MVLTPRNMISKKEKKEDEISLEMRLVLPDHQTRFPVHEVKYDSDGSKTALTQEQFAFQQFANKNLVQRVCAACILDKKKQGLCCCGRTEAWHTEHHIPQYPDQNTKWSKSEHTKSESTQAYGEIEFGGFGNVRSVSAKYCRVSFDTPVEILWKLLHNIWKLPPPKLVVSVTGGAKRFYMKPRLQNAFKQGLMDVASTTEAWIITGGTATGVMKYVGEALQEYQLSSHISGDKKQQMVAIGIAAWGCIDNKGNLENHKGDGCFPAVYSLRDCTAEENEAPLDHNHTNFILVDNGSEHKYGTEISLRANLEAFIAQKCAELTRATSNTNANITTPVVLIVCEGGPNTLQQTRDAIRVEIPAVVIKWSGRAADVIASAYRLSRPKIQTHHEERSEFSASFHSEMPGIIASGFGLHTVNELETIEKIMETLKEILSKRHLITVFELDDANCRDMDKAVLRALLKAYRNPQSQVDLALIWNRADIARQLIFTLENRRQWQTIALEDAMHAALLQGRADFVQLFLDNGIHLGSFLTVQRLRNLYKDCLDDTRNSMSLIFKHLLHIITLYETYCSFSCKVDVSDQDSILLFLIGKVLRFLLNDKFEQPYKGEAYIVEPDENGPRQKGGSLKQDFSVPEKDLFLWALMFNQSALARMFWRNCKDPLGGALMACRVLKSLAFEARQQEEIDLGQNLENEATYYEQIACGVLNSCYSGNKQLAQRLLRRQLENWGKTTLFSLAESAKLMDFMQLSCCQTKLNSLWYGKMVEHTQDWKILIGIFFPPFVAMIRFKTTYQIEDKATKQELLGMENKSMTELKQQIPTSEESDGNAALPKWRVGFGLCGMRKLKPGSITFLNALYRFYTAPITKFYVSLVFYLAFLCMFTVVVLAELKPVNQYRLPGIFELIIWAWACSLCIEGIRQVLKREAKTIFFKIFNHLGDFWNLLDVAIFTLFMLSLGLRISGGIHNQRYARITYAITLMLAYLRFMKFFYVSKVVGPKIIMIQKMLKDLLFFICILAVFILSFGIAMQSLLHPNEEFSFHLIIDAVYVPYWQIFGELFLERAEGKVVEDDSVCTRNESEFLEDPRLNLCPQQTWLVPLLSAVYMMLTNVLLLNLLIAMFSYTFQVVQDNSEKVWRFHRYAMVYMYYDIPALPAPFSIFTHIKRLISFIFRNFRGTYHTTAGFKKILTPEENLQLSAFEKAGMERHMARAYRISVEQIDSRVAMAGRRLDKVVSDLEEIKEQLLGENNTRGNSNDKLTVEEKMAHIDMKVNHQSELLKELLHLLRNPSSPD